MLYFGYKQYVKTDQQLLAMQQNNLPLHESVRTGLVGGLIADNTAPTLIESFRTLHSRRFTQRQFVDKMECGLCYQQFHPLDTVVNCKRMHVFHTQCYEEVDLDSAAEDEEEVS